MRSSSHHDEHRLELLGDLRLDERDVLQRDPPEAAVDCDAVPCAQDVAVHAHLAELRIDLHGCGSCDRGTAHAAGDERRVAGLAALAGEDPARRKEAGDVVRLGERAHEDHVAPLGRGAHRVGCAQRDLALGCAWRSGDAGGDHLVVGARVERRVQQRVERRGVDRGDRLLAIEQTLGHSIHCKAHSRLRGTLRVARLQHVKAPLLNRELGVLHVAVVALQRSQDVHQLLVNVRQPRAQLADVAWRAHARDDILALRVREEVPRGLRRARHLVARERHAAAAALAEVAEHHLLDVHRGAPLVGDAVDAAVGDRALALPGVEHGADRVRELLARVDRERVEALELARQRDQRLDVELRVEPHALCRLARRDRLLEAFPRHAEHDVAVHLHEPPV